MQRCHFLAGEVRAVRAMPEVDCPRWTHQMADRFLDILIGQASAMTQLPRRAASTTFRDSVHERGEGSGAHHPETSTSQPDGDASTQRLGDDSSAPQTADDSAL